MKFKKNNKGFSLVELIIVIAIMVALIAVLAPQFTKYVQSSRDAIVANSAEDVLTVAKAEYALGNLTGTGDITVNVVSEKIDVSLASTLAYKDATTGSTDFKAICGIDSQKTVKSTKSYTITVGGTASAPTFSLKETGTTPASPSST